MPRGPSDTKLKPTVSGDFLSESLRASMGMRFSPGAMFPTPASPPRTVGSPLPATSPRQYEQKDGRSGSVVIWGDGWSGQMHKQESSGLRARPKTADKEFKIPQEDAVFKGQKMLEVCGDYGCIIVLTDEGKMIYSGSEDLPEQQISVDAGSIRYVAVGYRHNVFLTEEGRLYSCGDNTYGQLGHTGAGFQSLAQPVPAFLERNAAAVCCGHFHTMALTDAGDVYAWGNGMEGQCGTGRCEIITVPRFVKGLHGIPVAYIAAGYAFSAAATQNGELYTWGDNGNGQLGLGGKAGRQATPRKVDVPGFIVSVACGWGHALCLSDEGSVHSWGFNLSGQLGHGDTTSRNKPQLVHFFEGLRQGERGDVVASLQCGAHFSVALMNSGVVYMWGSGANGRLGNRSNSNVLKPILCHVDGKKITRVAASHDRVLAFAPATITEIIPDCGPLSGNTHVRIKGEGLIDSPRIKIKYTFVLEDGSEDIRYSRGGYSQEDAMVVAVTPPIDIAADCTLEVSLDNGATYTSSGRIFSYYMDPVIVETMPTSLLVHGGERLELYGAGLSFFSQYCSVLFAPLDGGEEVNVRGIPVPDGGVSCVSPPLPAGEYRILVALNGQQYGDEHVHASDAGAHIFVCSIPNITMVKPDCVDCKLGGLITVCVDSISESTLIKLEGAHLPEPIILRPDEIDMDALAMSVNIAPMETPGKLSITCSPNGMSWSPESAGLYMHGPLEPVLECAYALTKGGLVNCLKDPNLFPGSDMQVKIGDVAVIPARYSKKRAGVVFEMPKYDEAKFPAEFAPVPLWLSVDGISFHPCGSVTYTPTIEVTDIKPAKSGKGRAPTAVTISGSGFVDTGAIFVKFVMEGNTEVVDGVFGDESSVSVTTPELAAGDWQVLVSINGQNGEWIESPLSFSSVEK